jgi:hypothetical protein
MEPLYESKNIRENLLGLSKAVEKDLAVLHLNIIQT